MVASVFFALLNALWQGTILIVLTALAMRAFPRLNAATTGAIWSAVFVLAAILPVVDVQHPGAAPLATTTVLIRTIDAHAGRALTLVADGPSVQRHPRLAAARAAVLEAAGSIEGPLLALWMTIAAVGLVRIGRAYAELERIKARAHTIPFDLGETPRGVRIAVSAEIPSACVAGFLHPVVLLPEADVVALAQDDLARIVRHEVAHLRRRDDWANLAQRIAGAVFFFHPALRYASRRIDDLREIACDDIALAGASAHEPRAYARTLAAVLERARGARRTVYAPAFGATKSHVYRRVEHVLDESGDRSPRVRRTGIAFIIAVLVVAAIVAPLQLPRPVTIDHRITLNIADASTSGGALLDALIASGYGTPSPDDLIALTNAGVSASDVVPARESSGGRPQIEALIRLANQDVSRSFTAALEHAIPGVTVDDIIRLSNADASVATIASLAAALGGHATVDDLVALLDADVDADFVQRLAQHGYRNLPAEKLIALKNSGFEP